jgi:hypothetical protein
MGTGMTVDREHCPELVELVNAEIDGELTGAQRAELNRLVLADPAVRALRDDLRRLCAAIDAIPAEEPPADLGARVMESLPGHPPVREDRDVHPRHGLNRPVLRYAAAFAGGLLISALAFHFAVDPRTLDSQELAGTLVAADPSRLQVELEQVRGTIELEGTARAPVVQTRLVAVRPVQVIARLEGQEIRLSGFAATPGEPTELSAAFSRAAVATPAVVQVEIVDEASGAVLRSARLRPELSD